MKNDKILKMLKNGIEKRERSNELTERQKNNRIKKDLKNLENVLNLKKVKNIDINIEWKKSIYGLNPLLEARVYFDNGYDYIKGIKASGCGYDKESTVIAELLNLLMKNELISDKLLKDKDNNKIPYGIALYNLKKGFLPYFESGVGVNCYYEIMKYLGYKLEHTANGKTFDAYRIEKIKDMI